MSVLNHDLMNQWCIYKSEQKPYDTMRLTAYLLTQAVEYGGHGKGNEKATMVLGISQAIGMFAVKKNKPSHRSSTSHMIYLCPFFHFCQRALPPEF